MRKKTIASIIGVFLIGLIAMQSAFAASDLAYLAEISDTSFLPSTIYAGDTVSLAVSIYNRGNAISIVDLNGVLDSGNQFEGLALEDSIDVIKAGATKTFVFKFRVKEETLPGYYSVFLNITYSRQGEEIQQTQSILVPVSRTEKNIDVTVEPNVINPGNQTELFFTLKNVGGTPVSNISFSWDEENDLVLPLGSDNKRYVSIIDAGSEQKVVYTVAADPNIEPGIYPLDITMTFTDVNGTRTQTSEVGLIVGGKTDFEVSAEISNGTQLSISIANIGSNNASALVARLPKQDTLKAIGSSISILGNLNKGDYTIASFEIQSLISKDASNTAPFQKPAEATNDLEDTRSARTIILEIDYTDTTGERQSIQKTIQLESSTAGTGIVSGKFRQQSDYSFVPWILLVAIIGGAAGFNKFKAGNKNWKTLAKILGIAAVLFLATIFLLAGNLWVSVIAGIVSVALLWNFFKKQKSEIK